jgi:glycerol-3-phosphate dehydrogenase
MNRNRMLTTLQAEDKPWDVVVIGGGATGLGTALEAVTRGYRVVLVEGHDFAKGTSSKSTKLIHGGVRYLRQGQINMVRQSLHERGRLQRNAPHLVRSRKFVIPSYQTGGRLYFYAGMKAYDLLAGRLGFESSQLLSTAQTLEALPTLNARGLRGGVAYADGQFDDARLAVALAQSCVDHGAVVLNYAPVIRLLHRSGQLCGVIARDEESGIELEIAAQVVVNATGVMGETIMQLDSSTPAQPLAASGDPPGVEASQARPQIVASQGTHLVLPRRFCPSNAAMLIPHTDDSRVLFAIPWHNRTLFGTTDQRVDTISLEPRPLAHEIDYLLEHAGRYLTQKPERSDILSVFAGLRPLVGSNSNAPVQRRATAQLSREHEIYTSPTGLITVIGGKWTTYRKMGQDVVDLTERVGSLRGRASSTANLALHAAPPQPPRPSWDESDEDPLAIYGTDRAAVLELAERETSYSQRLSPQLPYILAQVAWGVEHEMARTVEDILARRLRALLLDARACLAAAEPVATLMQTLLQRDDTWRAQQLESIRALVSNYLPTETI